MDLFTVATLFQGADGFNYGSLRMREFLQKFSLKLIMFCIRIYQKKNLVKYERKRNMILFYLLKMTITSLIEYYLNNYFIATLPHILTTIRAIHCQTILKTRARFYYYYYY